MRPELRFDMVILALLACVGPRPVTTPAPAGHVVLPPGDPGLSPEVLAAVDHFGEAGFYWPPDDGTWWGTPDEVRYLGLRLSPADPSRRGHCVGVTWEIALGVLQEAAGPGRPIAGLTLTQMVELRRDWFVRAVGGRGPAEAVEHSGIGVAVAPEALVPGDFVQLWYAWGGGHSGVFRGWERAADGEKTAITYWSVHPALGGTGDWTDPLGEAGVATIFGARLAPASAWIGAQPQ